MENKLTVTDLLALSKMASKIITDNLFDTEIVESVMVEISMENNLQAIYI